MAKESMKAREVKRAKLVARYAEKREALKKIIATSNDPAEAYEAESERSTSIRSWVLRLRLPDTL